jgi:hypothetical protein
MNDRQKSLSKLRFGRWRAIAGVAVIAVSSPFGAAEAEPVCGGLKTVFKNAPKKFEAISQPVPGEEMLKGKIVLGPLARCQVRKDQASASYQCMDHRIPPEAAPKIMAEIVSDIEKCFGKDVARSIDQPTQIMFDYLPDISISFDIGTTPKGGVVLNVDAISP